LEFYTMKFTPFILVIALAASLSFAQTTQPAASWDSVRQAMKIDGVVDHDVLIFRIPRSDLQGMMVNDMPIPIQAGLESVVRFFPCPCGRTLLNGELLLLDYEVNDVIDSLRNAQIEIVAISPAFLNSRPKLLVVRFQGDGDGEALAKAIREALRQTGPARGAVMP
jgi:hypothetical protein